MSAPYYQDDWATIYHGDCREVATALQYSVVCADPHYGNDWSPDNTRFTSKASDWWSVTDRSAATQMPKITGNKIPFDPTLWIDRPAILWGANHYASRLPDSGGWLVWDKRAGLEDVGQKWPMSEAELAWTNVTGHVATFRMRWMGMIRPQSEKTRYHPNQKPIALMGCGLGFLPDGVVLDPYMGSGPVLVAAKNLGRKSIGIEIEEKYCEIAAQRLSQGVLDLEGVG